jgi:arylsulfatase A-like enzyme
MPEGERWNARETTDVAIELLHAPHARRLLWVHYFDPHDPLQSVTPGVAPRYEDEFVFVDRELARLLESIPSERTLVVLTSDHGELFDASGAGFHAVTAREELIHVPAIMVGPTIAPNVYADLTSSRDLAPTILGAFGRCDANAERFGRSWLRLRDAPNAPLHEFVVTYSAEALRGQAYVLPLLAIVEPRIKLIETLESTLVEVYDPVNDPFDRIDRAAVNPAETARVRRRLALYRDIDGYF